MKKDYGPEIAKSILRASTQTFSKLLIDAGDSNPVVEGDYTALTFSAEKGNYQSIAVLAARHVDMNATDAAGRTALDLAYQRKWTGAFDALMAGGADPARTTQKGYNMLERIATTGDSHWADRITKHVTGEALNTRDADGNTPLMLALKTVHHGVALSYIKAGADVTGTNNAGESCIDLAKRYPFQPVFDAIAKAAGNHGLLGVFNQKSADVEETIKQTKIRLQNRRNRTQPGL